MKSAVHVASPPKKPLVIYDGECTFCFRLVQRWRYLTEDCVDYLPSQDLQIASRFPELPRENLEAAVHLIEKDGSVFTGAEAAFRALSYGSNPKQRLVMAFYERWPLFASMAERAYDFVARHRRIFSLLVKLAPGPGVSRPSHQLVRWCLLRSIGIIYLIAFLSLWPQIDGLIGSNGIVPAQTTIDGLRQAYVNISLPEMFHRFPTLCWLTTSNSFLHIQCGTGTILAVALIAGLAPVPCLFLLWLLYLSLATIGREFLGFQWDNLLIEAGFLAIFLAPLQMLPRLARTAPASSLVLWLFRWLLFRLMFESGCVKLLSGDAAWRNLTALAVHYETQPLPTFLAWYAHQLPLWFQKTTTVLMFGIELIVPFLIFAPRRFRLTACILFIALQTVIFLTGNYCFFNLLTIVLCLSLLDDRTLLKLLPAKWRDALLPRLELSANQVVDSRTRSLKTSQYWGWPRHILVPLVCIFLAVSLIEFAGMFRVRVPGSGPMFAVFRWVAPFRTLNSYGLFAVMTMTRPEIILQGSKDGANWLDYEFKYKPGVVTQMPKWVAPHQPRLDWQMWFAALSDYRQNPWLINFCVRLLQASPEASGLLKRNPFPSAPPLYVRALVYEYRFTDWATRRKTGAWWHRELKGIYLPPVGLRQARVRSSTDAAMPE